VLSRGFATLHGGDSRQLSETNFQLRTLELYCFTASTAWLVYEATQGDIFDHLLAILPEFGLSLYQHPSGSDLRNRLGSGAAVE